MSQQQNRENILHKIRQALKKSVPVPFPQSEGNSSVFTALQQDIDIEFAENFTKLQGRFSFCSSQQELTEQLQTLITTRSWKAIYCREQALMSTLQQNGFVQNYSDDLTNCDASITTCEQLVARTGSIVMSTAQQSGRTVSVYAPVHICVAFVSQLVYDVEEALQKVQQRHEHLPSLITLATGPSRTADIEKTLVVGVHGPKEVFCFLVQDLEPV